MIKIYSVRKLKLTTYIFQVLPPCASQNRYQGLLEKELKTIYNYDGEEKGSTQRWTPFKETTVDFKTVQEFSGKQPTKKKNLSF